MRFAATRSAIVALILSVMRVVSLDFLFWLDAGGLDNLLPTVTVGVQVLLSHFDRTTFNPCLQSIEALFHVSHLERLVDRRVKLAEDRRRNVRRRSQHIPSFRHDVWETEFRQSRHVGKRGQSLLGSDGE